MEPIDGAIPPSWQRRAKAKLVCQVLFLDIGQPVRIEDLAEDLIRVSGLTSGRDVSLQVVGRRPGERLQEELLMETEELRESEHENIFVAEKHGFDDESFWNDLEDLQERARRGDVAGAVELLTSIAER